MMEPSKLAQDLFTVGDRCIILLRRVVAGVHEAVVLSGLSVEAKGCGRHHQHFIGGLPKPLLRTCASSIHSSESSHRPESDWKQAPRPVRTCATSRSIAGRVAAPMMSPRGVVLALCALKCVTV